MESFWACRQLTARCRGRAPAHRGDAAVTPPESDTANDTENDTANDTAERPAHRGFKGRNDTENDTENDTDYGTFSNNNNKENIKTGAGVGAYALAHAHAHTCTRVGKVAGRSKSDMSDTRAPWAAGGWRHQPQGRGGGTVSSTPRGALAQSLRKNVRKCLRMSCGMRTFAAMRHQESIREWVVTGVSRLSGCREELTGGMPSRQAAAERMERYKANTRTQRYPTYTRLRVEPRLPVQLTIQFKEYE